MANIKRTADDLVSRMIQLAENKYNCSQIMMALALEQESRENPDLIRAMSGLGDGCGFFNETCGIMTGAASILGWYAGKGADEEVESEKLLPMLEELGDWFRQEIATQYNGTRCKEIVGDLIGTDDGKQICGTIIFQTFGKVNEILATNGFRLH